MKKKNLAFTLAEVLIVIGIIGVVAALTLPNLNHATGDKEKVTRLKKVYSNLTEALDRAQAIYGPFDTWFNDLSTRAEKSERFANRVTEFLKISKDCGTDIECYPATIKYFDGQGAEDLSGYTYPNYVLPDGSALIFYPPYQYNDICSTASIGVDIDGANKGPNQKGHDIFTFAIYKNNLTPSDTSEVFDTLYDPFEGDVGGDVSYYTHWVITNENLDYLKANEDGVCPNGAQLNWNTQTSCN